MDATQIQPIASIPPDTINFDDKNPRGETAKQIQEDRAFKELRKSVRHFGVLVPLVTRKTANHRKPYKLVDGERRLRAALAENQALVPIHVIEGKETDGRILAYNIHMLRKQWTKPNELTSIKEIRDELLKNEEGMTDDELFAKLKEITNHTPTQLRDLLTLLKYDKTTIDKVQNGTLAMSHLIQIDASFLAPVEKCFPELYNQYGDPELRRILVTKAENGRLGNTRYLMDNVVKYFRDGKDGKYIFSKNKTKLKRLIRGFLKSAEENISNIPEKMEATPKAKNKTAKTKKKVKKKAKKKSASRTKADGDTQGTTFAYASINITKRHFTRLDDIRPKLEKIASTFTGEEAEYIKEAVCCLENHCFKAAALMVWASGVSRILRYIGNNLSDFNSHSKEMSDAPKSYYKYFARNFQKNATDVQDIRENSNDRQLLCYLCYKDIIDVTDFKKLKKDHDTRNDCAHPTGISLSPNEIIVMFEDVYNLLLNNTKLK